MTAGKFTYRLFTTGVKLYSFSGPSSSAPVALSTITLTPLSAENRLEFSSESEDSDAEYEGAQRGSDSGGSKIEKSEDEKSEEGQGGSSNSPKAIIEPEVEKSVPSTSNEATQQEASANADNAQGRGAGITAAQMKKALDEIMHPTYVAKVNISNQDINNAKDGLRDVTSLAFDYITRIVN